MNSPTPDEGKSAFPALNQNALEEAFFATSSRVTASIELLSMQLRETAETLVTTPAASVEETIALMENLVSTMELYQAYARDLPIVAQPADLSKARILTLSTAQSHEGGYLTYAKESILEVFGSAVKEVTFVPYALANYDAYTEKVRSAFSNMGLSVRSVHEAEDPAAAISSAEAVFVGGGNTFRLLAKTHTSGVFAALRNRVEDGMPYLGASAGSNLAMKTAGTTNDMPIATNMVPQLHGLHLFPFTINPHYMQKVEGTAHLGESRDLRIQQFHEEQPLVPVIGLPEGCGILSISGASTLVGSSTQPAKLFRAGQPAIPLACNSDLSSASLPLQ